jgi:hypothetical protein
MTPKAALAFVAREGIVLQAARGPVPSLAEAVAGGPIRGSWWGHPKGKQIFAAADAVSDSPDVLVCTLVEGRITFVHRRLWPALVRMAARFPKERLARVWEEHTATGAHRSRREAFPRWVPEDVRKAAEALSDEEAEAALGAWPILEPKGAPRPPERPRPSRLRGTPGRIPSRKRRTG